MYTINIKSLFGNSKSSSKSKEFMSFEDKKNLFIILTQIQVNLNLQKEKEKQ